MTEKVLTVALRCRAAALREWKAWSERQEGEPAAPLREVQVARTRAMLARLPLATVGPAPTFGPDLMGAVEETRAALEALDDTPVGDALTESLRLRRAMNDFRASVRSVSAPI